jgi:hypothetical protein
MWRALVFFVLCMANFAHGAELSNCDSGKVKTLMPALPRGVLVFDAWQGYFGAICVDSLHRTLRVYDSTLKLSLEILPEGRRQFGGINLSGNSGFILVCFYPPDDESDVPEYCSYDLYGRKLAGPIAVRCELEGSPHGKFYYGRGGISDCDPLAAVYGPDGKQIKVLHPTDPWQLTAIDDSTILYQNGYQLHTIAVPRMQTIKDMTWQTELFDVRPEFTAVSGDHRMYAFAGHDGYVIFDLAENRQFLVKRDKSYSPQPIGLSRDGSNLIVPEVSNKGATLSLYQRSSDSYLPILVDKVIDLPSESSMLWKSPIIKGDLCIINYAPYNKFESFIFRISDGDSAIARGTIEKGYSTFGDMESGRIWVYTYLMSEDGRDIDRVKSRCYEQGTAIK